jgi:hypothetical protein
VIRPAHVTFFVSGSDATRWVGYGFVKNGDRRQLEGMEDLSYEGFQGDPITRGKFDANKPIGDPRAYFLVVLEVWAAHMLGEWRYLVRNMQRSVHECVSCDFFRNYCT